MRIKRLCLLLLFLVSCQSRNDIGTIEAEYINAYKKAVLYGCLNEASNENFQKFILENNDLGLAVETAILYHDEVLKATDLGAQLAKNIRTISYADYEGKRPVYSDCIDFAFSSEIDSVASERYRVLIKAKIEYIYE